MPLSITEGEMEDLLDRMKLLELDDVNPRDFVGFGMMNSETYRKKFEDIALAAKLSSEEFAMVVFLSCLIPNKKRILNHMEKLNKAGSTWYTGVKKFLELNMVQYTKEESGRNSNFSIVHVPNAFPFEAVRFWALSRSNEERTPEALLQHTWAAQLHLTDELQNIQMAWEKDFWDNTVTKGGKDYEKGFNQAYYDTKKGDSYPMRSLSGNLFRAEGGTNEKYTMADLKRYCKEFDRDEDPAAEALARQKEEEERRRNLLGEGTSYVEKVEISEEEKLKRQKQEEERKKKQAQRRREERERQKEKDKSKGAYSKGP